jgi:hypothetical protein
VKFKEAVENTAELAEAWCAGLQAMEKIDKPHVEVEDTHRLRGSVNLDSVLKANYPNDSRWDYGIGHLPENRKHEMVYWVEVHPANDRAVKEMSAKIHWLRRWLSTKAKDLDDMHKEIIWVSSGKTSFTLTSPQQKQFALLGLQHKGKVFTIPNKAAA